MKFVKAALTAALIVPTAASAQNNPPAPTNFVFMAPLLTAFIAAPVILGRNKNNTVAPAVIIPTPTPTPTPSTTSRTR